MPSMKKLLHSFFPRIAATQARYSPQKLLRRRKQRRADIPCRRKWFIRVAVYMLCAFVYFTTGFPFRDPRRFFFRQGKSFIKSCSPLDSKANITSKGLYDKILFDDIDGGVWKQGWGVQYRGDEWDTEKLKVFVVPHSHNDPGWLMTVGEYYRTQTKLILETILTTLLKDASRKFIWEEMSYLQMWWEEASSEQKENLKMLVQNGQLEIVGGGWVMNDEANSHYYAIIEQITEGNVWLLDNLGVRPRNAWAIDPFGHSPTMAYVYRQMGFENMLIQRVHYEVKKALARTQSLEFWWRQSWDHEGGGKGAHDRRENTDMLCHMMPFYSYDIPHTCGPDPAICCQFDFARMPSASAFGWCPWGKEPKPMVNVTNATWVGERALMLLDQYRKKNTLYNTSSLLVPLGDDFRYLTQVEADAQFDNYEILFKYINSHPELKAHVQWGTLHDYFSSMREELRRRHPPPAQPDGRSDDVADVAQLGLPVLSGDFFTYADRNQHYWSGYYVSRPFFKAVDRVLEDTLRAADILFALDAAYGKSRGALATQFGEQVIQARRNLALFQHHDGITGTAKDHVVLDYGTRLHKGLEDLQAFMARAVPLFLARPGTRRGEVRQLELPQFEPETVRGQYDALPTRVPVALPQGAQRHVAIYNPLEREVERMASVVLQVPPGTTVCVVDDETQHALHAQRSPEWGPGCTATGREVLHWVAKVPPFGLKTYSIMAVSGADGDTNGHANNGICKRPAVRATVEAFNVEAGWSGPDGYAWTVASKKDVGPIQLQSRYHQLHFDISKGLLERVFLMQTDMPIELAVREDFAMYLSSGSGAYLFLPTGEAESIVGPGGRIVVSKGPLVQEVRTEPAFLVAEGLRERQAGQGNDYSTVAPIVRSARLYQVPGGEQGQVWEMQHLVNFKDRDDLRDCELVVRYRTGVASGPVFYSDLNGFQTIRRETYDKIPTQGNFYPMPTYAFIEDSGQLLPGKHTRFSVHSRQAVGVASLESGWLEMMLDRRLSSDDGRGLGQGVLDNHPTDVTFHLLLEHSSFIRPPAPPSAPLHPSALSNLVTSSLGYPFHSFIATKSEPQGEKRGRKRGGQQGTAETPPGLLLPRFAPLIDSLPCNMHVLSLKVVRPAGSGSRGKESRGEQPALAMLLQRRGWDCTHAMSGRRRLCNASADGVVDLGRSFRDLRVVRLKESSLNLVHDRLGGAIVGASNVDESRQERREGGVARGGLQEGGRGVVAVPEVEIVALKFDLVLKNAPKNL